MANDTIQLGGVPLKAIGLGDGSWALATDAVPYTTPVSGELISGTVALQGPNVAVKYVYFHTPSANSGTVYLGAGTAVSAPDGTADITTGMPYGSDITGPWLPVDNLNRLYHKASADSQKLIYFGLR
jgi:hypothetical protein